MLIDKIIIKLKQIILEYNFIKKILNSSEFNKVDFFKKFKEIMAKDEHKQEKENYINCGDIFLSFKSFL